MITRPSMKVPATIISTGISALPDPALENLLYHQSAGTPRAGGINLGWGMLAQFLDGRGGASISVMATVRDFKRDTLHLIDAVGAEAAVIVSSYEISMQNRVRLAMGLVTPMPVNSHELDPFGQACNAVSDLEMRAIIRAVLLWCGIQTPWHRLPQYQRLLVMGKAALFGPKRTLI